MDFVTHNHSNPTNGAFNLFDSNSDLGGKCDTTKENIEEKCNDSTKKNEKGEDTGEKAPWYEKHCGPLDLKSSTPAIYDDFQEFAETYQSEGGIDKLKGLLGGAEVDHRKKSVAKFESVLKKHKDFEASPDSLKGKSEAAKEKRRVAREIMVDTQEAVADAEPCLRARKCALVSYDKSKKSKNNKASKKSKDEGCCPNQTGHHILPDSMFTDYGKLAAEQKKWASEQPLKKDGTEVKASDMPRGLKPRDKY